MCQLNAYSLNQLVSNGYKEFKTIPKNEYLNYITDIYKNNDNFLVDLPNIKDIKNIRNPFKCVQNEVEATKYFLSNYYWGDQFAITSICRALKLNIIVLSYENETNIKIDYGVFKSDDHNSCNDWEKLVFVYHYEKHFELIVFDKNQCIFDRVEVGPRPPDFILFFIYGCRYYGLTPEQKNTFTLYPNFMKSIDKIINIILNPCEKCEEAENKRDIFVKLFNTFFTNNQITPDNVKINNLTTKKEDGDGIVGGAGLNKKKYGYIDNELSNLAYYIHVDMELYPGTSITPEIKKDLHCRRKWNSVRKAFANFTGQKYVVQPMYELYTPEDKKPLPEDKKQGANTRKNLKRGGNSITKKNKRNNM